MLLLKRFVTQHAFPHYLRAITSRAFTTRAVRPKIVELDPFSVTEFICRKPYTSITCFSTSVYVTAQILSVVNDVIIYDDFRSF